MASSSRRLMARAGGRPCPRVFLSRKSSSPYALALLMLLMLSLVVLLLLALGIFSLPVSSDSGPESEADLRHHARSLRDADGLGQRGQQWTEVISWEPRAFVYHNFLKSSVVDSTTGKSKDSRVRTSTGMFLPRGQDKIIRVIEKRISDYTFIPVENGEGLQVLHYEVGQKYEPHFDYFLDEFNTMNGGQRMATLLMYLSDVEEGGETIFPNAKINSSSLPLYNELSECGKKGISVRPKMGDALLFWSMKPDATLDPLSLHGGCPVIRGNKWSSTKWMHVHEYKV
ncbi:probable prolyl 4-hydroxylase 3 isoform X2 [Musa acuminata AAA Group]|uniref:probable prolyl 4-hydroxylase 3 isoform X2 n=1 Tax=Musa acuminata AAA Group TaxID=214697 RepID=UPI0008A0AE62|nr:PREDICTED: probable prolyl 4-hydroxylase 3 isoform X2 [Musa acuminata subsp. malaccensis]